MKPRKTIKRSGIKRKPVSKKRAKSELTLFKKKLWKKFAAFVKKRDGEICFSCGRPTGKGYNQQAGHMFSAGMYPAIRWDLMNCHVQCSRCNVFTHGNYIEYHQRFKDRFGQVEYDRLHSRRNDFVQWRLEDLKEIEKMIDATDISTKETRPTGLSS